MISRAHEADGGVAAVAEGPSADPAAPDPAPTADSVPRGERFAFVDGLRGLAALAVLVFHFTGYFLVAGRAEDYSAATRAAIWVGRFGHLGVDVFFVISGFVIAHSLRNAVVVDWGTLWRFVVRRSIRIDPPYWAALLLILAIHWGRRATGDAGDPRVESAGQVLAHFAYLQDLLGYRPLSPVLWTLCLEIQFYLVFILSAFAVRGRWAHGAFVAVTFAASLALAAARVPMHGWFVGAWYLFATGVATYGWHAGRIGWPVFAACVGAVLVWAAAGRDAGAATAAATALALAGASATRGGLTGWLRAAPAQFLGRVSYSLYLLHLTVGSLAYYQLRGRGVRGEAGVWAIVALATLASLAAAALMHRFVEAPSVALARRVAGRTPPVTTGASRRPR